jgi:predicted nucleotidyltransferase
MEEKNIKTAIKDLKQRLTGRFGSDIEAYLFGSVARGDFGPSSDIDILVLVAGEVNNSVEEEVFSLAYDMELQHNVVFGIVVYSKDFWNSRLASYMPLYKNVKREGIYV